MNSHLALNLASRIALCFGLVAPLMTGCVAADADVADESIGEADEALSPPPPPPPPASCQDIKAKTPGAVDGEYTLFINHDPSKPWTAFCHAMGTSPAEFLSLHALGNDHNFSQYTAGGAVSGSNVRTLYGKVRVDPATLLVDISDQTFSTSSGSLIHGGETVSSMPYGVAMSCDDSPSGAGNIDLTGTPFAVATGEFLQGGTDSAAGTSTYSSDNRVVNLTGGGYCGWTCASPATFNPFNTTGTFQLQLVFQP